MSNPFEIALIASLVAFAIVLSIWGWAGISYLRVASEYLTLPEKDRPAAKESIGFFSQIVNNKLIFAAIGTSTSGAIVSLIKVAAK